MQRPPARLTITLAQTVRILLTERFLPHDSVLSPAFIPPRWRVSNGRG